MKTLVNQRKSKSNIKKIANTKLSSLTNVIIRYLEYIINATKNPHVNSSDISFDSVRNRILIHKKIYCPTKLGTDRPD
jgi:hypothetical protein